MRAGESGRLGRIVLIPAEAGRMLRLLGMLTLAMLVGPQWAAGLTMQQREALQQEMEQLVGEHGLDENAEAVRKVEEGELSAAVASWWGFDEEDATDAIQGAFDSGAPTVFVPEMDQPWIARRLHLRSDDQTVFFEPGVRIEAKEGEFHATRGILLKAVDLENVRLIGYGAVLAMRKADYQQPPYETSEHRHTLSIRGCRNFQVYGLELRESGGDGIYLAGLHPDRTPPENILVRDVRAEAHHRQGMSVISVRGLVVENSVFANTSGTAPMAGIDLEPNNPQDQLVDIVIRNNLFLDNDALGMHNWPRRRGEASEPVSIVWENNYVRGSPVGIHVGNVGPEARGHIRFRNNIIADASRAGILLRRISAESELRIEFENNIIHSSATDAVAGGRPAAPIVLDGLHDYPPRQGGVSFNNDLVIHTRPGPAVLIEGPWDDPETDALGEVEVPDEDEHAFEGWFDIDGQVRVLNPHGVSMEKRVPVGEFSLSVVEPPHESAVREVVGAYVTLHPPYPAEVEELSLAAADRVAAHVRSQLFDHAIEVHATVHVNGRPAADAAFTLEPGQSKYPLFQLNEPLEATAEVELSLEFHKPADWPESQAAVDFEKRTATRVFDLDAKQTIPYVDFDVSIDGDLSPWQGRPYILLDERHLQRSIETRGLTQARLYTGWDEQYFYLAAEVHDQEHHNEQRSAEIWNGDAIQFAIAPFPTEFQFFVLGAALAAGEVKSHQWTGPDTGVMEASEYALVRDAQRGRTYYELRMPFERLKLDPRDGTIFAFNIVVFEDSGENEGYDYWLQLTPGLAGGHDHEAFQPVILRE